MKLTTLTLIVATLSLGACDRLAETEAQIARNAMVSSLNLSLDEQNIWDTLTLAQQNRAIAFIQNGGSLIASLGDE